ncbi:cell division protein FtsL [Sneathiella sp.]|uniref:cell division protein FtsL n=1 Tax=Sneathiella sp. TaxID=1964365 RepID=UPI002FE2E9A6
MKLKLTVLSILLLVGVSGGLYQLSYEVQELEREYAALNESISRNKESIRILKAEWTYQNRPDVLQAMAGKYLPLLLIAPYQVASVSEVPYPPVNPDLYSVPVPQHNPRRNYSPAIPSQPAPNGPIQLATYSTAGGAQ